MTPILSTTGGGSVRGFGRRRPVPSGPSGPSGPPSGGSFTSDDVTSLTTSRTRFTWTNADAEANVYLYRDSVFVSDLGVNATNSGFQSGVLATSYLYEVSAYKNGIESAKYNMGGAKTLAAYPTQVIYIPAGSTSPPSTWNNANNFIIVYGPGERGENGPGQGGAAGKAKQSYNLTWSGAVAVVVGAPRAYGADETTSSIATSPAVLSSDGTLGGAGGAAGASSGGGGGGVNSGTDGSAGVGSTGGAGGMAGYGGAGGDNGSNGQDSSGPTTFDGLGRNGGGGGGGSGGTGGAGGPGGAYCFWGA